MVPITHRCMPQGKWDPNILIVAADVRQTLHRPVHHICPDLTVCGTLLLVPLPQLCGLDIKHVSRDLGMISSD
jgi:hypothetical protein